MEHTTNNDIGIYPLTIIRDRYHESLYEYLAFNLESWDVPKEINDDGLDYWSFWMHEAQKYIIGKGDTVQEALEDLKAKLKPAPENPLVDKFLFIDFERIMDIGNKDAVENLLFIVEQTHCKIIITSLCRRDDPQQVKELWDKYQMPMEYYSMTPILTENNYKDPATGEPLEMKEYGFGIAPALEIGAWLNTHVTQDFLYAILDLEESIHFDYQSAHLVTVDSKKGFTRANANEVISILNGKT